MTISETVLVLWLLPVSWLVHDLEEIATIDRWSRRWGLRKSDDLTPLQRRLVGVLTSTRRRFTVAVGFVGCVVVGATAAGTFDPNGPGILIYTTILGGYFLHSFVHVGQSIVFRGYTPGLATAISVVIPVSILLYWRLLSAGLVDIGTVRMTGILGLVLFVPFVVGANRLSKRIDRWIV
ncbi:HXXEE domain-containing protein [Salinigranum marinum]|uniref:HXXEE domain-containing protein n=1 Tax=Salinigranum marinum TaxID=1515595 RepID=UPI002989B126|nr:HXXEE domain-containing protein [Salinigranum marinum]